MSGPSKKSSGQQVRRLLQLVPYLHARGGVKLFAAAEALGVTPEQLLADLKVLLMCGLPEGFPDDLIDVDLEALEVEDEKTGRSHLVNGVISVRNADYLTQPVRFTPTEASALIVALRALRTNAASTTRTVVDRTLAKLEAAAATQSRAVESADQPNPLGDLRAVVARAVQDRRQIAMTYYVPSRDEESNRLVDPLELMERDGVTYLRAYCHSAEAPRLFRLDRVHELSVCDTSVVTEPHEAASAQFSFETATDVPIATLRLHPPARWIVEYYPVLEVREQANGVCEVDLAVAEPAWLRRLLMRLAPSAELVAPSAYADEHVSTVRDALSHYL